VTASVLPAEPGRAVALVTLGCARNDVDSEELAARLEADGWTVVAEPADADAVLVNTCGFIESAKKDSIDTLLAAADLRRSGRPQAVVAVGCLAERYGVELASSLPEADAVLGFDDYPAIGDRLRSVLAGSPPAPHVPSDRRRLLPVSPVERPGAAPGALPPGHGDLPAQPRGSMAPLPPGVAPASGPRVLRRRLDQGPMAPLKLASGCDRRCTFCAIPSYRGAFISRRPAEILHEARWLAAQGVRELVLVSENSSSYGKDLGDGRLLETLLPELAAVEGVQRVRVSYLQPAETRPSLVEVIASTTGVAAYFDLSFQHASAGVLRRMRRFGGTESFLELLAGARFLAPAAGARSNVIVGFPGETEDDLAELERFLTLARLDAVGVFGYSDEEGTEAATHGDKIEPAQIRARVERVSRLVEELTAQRAEERIGEVVEVLVETVEPGQPAEGRAEHQGPEVDGTTTVDGPGRWRVGQLVTAVVVSASGVDLVAEPVPGQYR